MPSVIDSPSGRSPEKAPRWDLTGTEVCGGGKVVLWLLRESWTKGSSGVQAVGYGPD